MSSEWDGDMDYGGGGRTRWDRDGTGERLCAEPLRPFRAQVRVQTPPTPPLTHAADGP